MRFTVSSTSDDDRLTRARRARQVIAGSEIRIPPRAQYSLGYATHDHGLFSAAQRNYLIALAVLLALGLVLYVVFSFGVASIIFFLLALTLLAGWIVF